MCAACLGEYEDPTSRRFHAQPNACPACGPSLSLIDRSGRSPADEQPLADEQSPADERSLANHQPLATATAALLAGQILALKGVGGYHLACRADDEAAAGELRRRKGRERKPFALMARDLAAVRRLVHLTPLEQELLGARERPILLARRRSDAQVADSVAPRSRELGVMLPSSPLHHLLLADTGTTLVMTSGNISDEPTVHRDGDAMERLAGVADLTLAHDRPIHARADDSVLASRSCGSGRPLMFRRSRGYAPVGLALPVAVRPLLACGAELKSTFCLAKGRRAWVGPHVGDLKNWETLRSFGAGIAHFEELFSVRPELIAHDLHPDYLSTAYALQRDEVELLAVQHHHAHLAACLAEHGERGTAIGAIYDGAGLGSDGAIWGGELLVGNLRGAERAGHLVPVRLPGGDAAAREPWRMACAWLLAAFERELPAPRLIAGRIGRKRWEQVTELARSGTSSPVTTSVGRLFDAVAAVCGIATAVREEGRAAMELEWAAAGDERGAYPLPVVEAEALQLDARETVRAILADLRAGASTATVSARFHNGLSDATAAAVSLLAQRRGVGTAVLAGGVFQNRLLLERTVEGLASAGLRVLVPRQLPPNDGAIAYGQAAVAAMTVAEDEQD
jgi:hydrogenase maturation protein HypF